MSNVINTLAMPMIKQLFCIMPNCSPRKFNESPTSDQILSESLQKVYILFLQNIIINNMSSIFILNESIEYTKQIFTTLLASCTNVPDPNVTKSTFTMLRKLIQQWLLNDATIGSNSNDNSNSNPNIMPIKVKQMFIHLLMEDSSSVLLQSCIQFGFNPSDAAMTLSMHKEVIKYQLIAVQALGIQYINHFVEKYLVASLSLSNSIALQYKNYLINTSVGTNNTGTASMKQFRKYFSSLMKELNMTGHSK
jgi:hypothetical protein